ncbi:MAG: hypothetical protein AAGA15_00595 [Pseudomonadota bacterium]
MATQRYRARDSVTALDLVERRMGKEAYIVSLEWEDGDVVVLASDQPVSSGGQKQVVAPAQAPSKRRPDQVRPKFLDPMAPKPFPATPDDEGAPVEREVQRAAEPAPHGPRPPEAPAPDAVVFKRADAVHRQAGEETFNAAASGATDEAEDQTAGLPAQAAVESPSPTSAPIVLFTLNPADLFALWLRFSHLVPLGQLVSWREGEAWPLEATGSRDHPQQVVLATASDEVLARMISTAAHAPGIAAIYIVPPGQTDKAAEFLAPHLDPADGAAVPPSFMPSTPPAPPTAAAEDFPVYARKPQFGWDETQDVHAKDPNAYSDPAPIRFASLRAAQPPAETRQAR